MTKEEFLRKHYSYTSIDMDEMFKSDLEELLNAEREKTIDEVKSLIKTRLVDNLSLENATKYGNENAKQQSNSYATVMKYEIADCIEDLYDDLEQLKGE